MKIFYLSLLVPTAVTAQLRPDLYRCEGCEAIYEHSFDNLSWETVIPRVGEPGERLILTGRVYQSDGTTPAPDVIIYVHHTNSAGVYPMRGDEEGWGRRHGYLRGWVKSNSQGAFRFVTIRPGPYPGRADPAHIHITIKEPDRREYWIDDVVFDDDPRVTDTYRAQRENRGGNGISTPKRQPDGTWLVQRDIVLEPRQRS